MGGGVGVVQSLVIMCNPQMSTQCAFSSEMQWLCGFAVVRPLTSRAVTWEVCGCGCVGVGVGVCVCGCVGVGVCGCVCVGVGVWVWVCGCVGVCAQARK